MLCTNRRKFFWMCLGAGATVAGASPMAAEPRGGTAADLGDAVRRTGFALGTEVSLTVFDADAEKARRALDAAWSELETVDRVMSLYRAESEVCRLNREGRIDSSHPLLVEILRSAAAMSRRSQGAFDVTIQPLWLLYQEAARGGAIPDAGAVAAIQGSVDWRKVHLDDRQIRLEGPGMAITLNGVAQGFAADRIKYALRRRGIRHALVNAGELAALGEKPNGEAWTAGVQHPRRADAYLALASLRERCLSTSGDYATPFTGDLVHHHLLDPRTGRSPRELASVSVAAASATEADALSTAVFVAGLEQGLKLVQATPGADALLVFKNGKTLATAGFPAAAIEGGCRA